MELTFTVLAALSAALTAISCAAAHAVLRRRRPAAASQPPITVLKPLKGLDDEQVANLVSFAEQDYPRYQLVLGACDPDDPALEVARQVKARYPRLEIEVVAGAAPHGLNPKVTNLASMTRRAAHELWLISDSNVRAEPGYLADVAAEIEQPGVGMVTNIFAGVGARRLGARLENLHLNSWIPAGMGLTQVFTREACVVGKSMLFRRADLERVGGLASMRDVLAEDYVLGLRFAAAGMRVVTSPHVLRTVNASWSVRRFLSRHLRWGQIRRRISPAAFFGEPLINPSVWGLACLAAGAPVAGGAALAVKLLSDASLSRRVLGRAPRPLELAAIPLKDLAILGVWCVAAFRREVVWRGHKLRIGPGTVLEPAVSLEPEGRPLAPAAQP
jgi:ceramide glucosyltransferase